MTLSEDPKSRKSKTYDRLGKSLDALRSVMFSVSSRWSSNLKTGWREFPDKASESSERSFPDLWSTSQALEILIQLLMDFRVNGYAISRRIENNSKKAILAGMNLLLQNRDTQSQLGSDGPVSSLGLKQKPDVIGLAWQLRAISQALKASEVLSLPIRIEPLFRKGESLLRDLFVLQDPNGGWSSFGDVGRSTYVTGMIVWAIAEAYPVFEEAKYLRPHKVHSTYIAVEWLLKNRIQKGGFPFFEGGATPTVSRTALTSIAIWARREMKCPEPTPEIDLALNNVWIIEHQDLSTGGWSDSLEGDAKPDVEVTSLALLALLKSGAKQVHPSIRRVVDWLLSSLRVEDETYSGWGVYPHPNVDSNVRIWTTWYAVLALREFVSRSKKREVSSFDCQVSCKPRLVFLSQGDKKTVTIQLRVHNSENAWAFLSIKEKDAGIEIVEPKVVRLQEPKTVIYLRLHQLKKGLMRCIINLHDLIEGKTTVIPIRVVSPGRFYKSVLSASADPKVVVTSLAASSAIYAFFKLGYKVTIELALDLLCVGFGTILMVLVFAYFKHLSHE